MKNLALNIIYCIFLASSLTHAKVVRYELQASQIQVNLSGNKNVNFALALNGQIPAPTLEFTEGDEAEILVINNIPNQELSLHWHGILLSPEMDGVPYVTTKPIRSGESLVFKFKLRQHGTYWYHSHTNVQEQKGLYGAIIIHPKKPTYNVDKDFALVISDWSDEDAIQILNNLRKDGEYYARKKNTVRSWWGAIRSGKLHNLLINEWNRMGGMDLSDVGYDAFLVNGKKDDQIQNIVAGDLIRLRIINAAASSYFYIRSSNDPLKVISADGIDIVAVEADELLIGMAETYDLLFKMPDNESHQFKFISQDASGAASLWLGRGIKNYATERMPPDPYEVMSHTSHPNHQEHNSVHDHAAHHEHHGHQLRQVLKTLTVDDLKSPRSTKYQPAKVTELKLVLDGDMDRYIWHINGLAIHEERNIFINEGEVVRFTFENKTMMHHPMHLHGHFFRVLNKFGDYSPLKHTVDVPPHGTRTIEFLANEPGEWMLHCHNLYHLKTGMARVVKYTTYMPKPEIVPYQKMDPHLHDHFYWYANLIIASTHAEGIVRTSQTWNTYELRLESEEEYQGDFEGDLIYRRHLLNTWNIAFGGTSTSYDGQKTERTLLGLGYMFPLLIHSTLYVDSEGDLRIDLHKEFQWTNNWSSEFEYRLRKDEPTDGVATLMYSRSWSWASGLIIKRDKFGFGIKAQF